MAFEPNLRIDGTFKEKGKDKPWELTCLAITPRRPTITPKDGVGTWASQSVTNSAKLTDMFVIINKAKLFSLLMPNFLALQKMNLVKGQKEYDWIKFAIFLPRGQKAVINPMGNFPKIGETKTADSSQNWGTVTFILGDAFTGISE